MSASPLPIAEWIQALRDLPDEGFAAGVSAFMDQHRTIEPASLAPYRHFACQRYTRNLIHRDERFEVLALCWDEGQVSSVHDHCEQHCWVVCVQGKVQSQSYRPIERDEARGICRLEPGRIAELEAGGFAEVHVDEVVHQVRNLAEFGQQAITLHVYAAPVDTCEIYDLNRGTFRRLRLVNWSEYGQLTGACV